MSDAEIIKTLAKFEGWENIRYDYADGSVTFKRWLADDKHGRTSTIDSYTSHGAIQHVLEKFDEWQSEEYAKQLWWVLHPDSTIHRNHGWRLTVELLRASARQKAEAAARVVQAERP